MRPNSTYLLALVVHAAYAVAADDLLKRQTVTLPASIDVAPTITPIIYDPSAPDPQQLCPGYSASNVQITETGLTADLDLAGPACQTYGNDIDALSLTVELQTEHRLRVNIQPRYLVPFNESQYNLPAYITPLPRIERHQGNDLTFEWSNTPSFQFRVLRHSDHEVLFDTFGTVLVFQDQFTEVVTSMVPEYNLYGLPENIHDFRLGNNYTQTLWATSDGNAIDSNEYGSHPVYLETRYNTSASTSSSHGLYARNAHGQEWLLRESSLTYRTLGGSLDIFLLSGPQPGDVIAQYQHCVGFPAMPQYWTLGFHQCRWGYNNWTELQDVVNGYRDAEVPLEAIWTDIDAMQQFRDFTWDGYNFPVPEGQAFVEKLHQNNQYYVPIIDANIYVPNPENASDAYEPFSKGAAANAFIREDDEHIYIGDQWPGFSAWPDWTVPGSHDMWEYELIRYHNEIPWDGLWVDLGEANSYCIGSCGDNSLQLNPVAPPFALPGDPGDLKYNYPSGFVVTNASETASASAALASISSVSAALATSTAVTTAARTLPMPGVRNVNFPPYQLNNVEGALVVGGIAPNATHNDQYNTTEYELHNVYGHMLLNATYRALQKVIPGRRPFIMARSTFSGSGAYGGHWGGDNTSNWGSMYLAISQALQFAIAGVPFFGPDTCGFDQNTDFELCSRWMAMSAFFPFYRNHNIKSTIPQEAYRWAIVAAASRNAMDVRYSMLPYIYTLFHKAHTQGHTVMRALQWEFPTEAYLANVDNQFMLGPAVLVTPVLEPLVTQVNGIFPGVEAGTVWYDAYTLQPIEVAPRENKTLDAPLDFINVHLRGGHILPLQLRGYTTTDSRQNPFKLLIVLDRDGEAHGSLYLDDGYSIEPNATKEVELQYAHHTLNVSMRGTFDMPNPLANVTIAGFGLDLPKSVQLCGACGRGSVHINTFDLEGSMLHITGLEDATACGVWSSGWSLKIVP